MKTADQPVKMQTADYRLFKGECHSKKLTFLDLCLWQVNIQLFHSPKFQPLKCLRKRVESSFLTTPVPTCFHPEIRIPGFQIKHRINWKVDTSSCGIMFLLNVDPFKIQVGVIFKKCSFRSDQHLQMGFCVPRSNCHAVCSTLIRWC